MKKYISTTVLALALAIITPEVAFGQWDYNSHVIDNIISSRIDRRRTAARMRARKSARSTVRRRAVKRKYNRRNSSRRRAAIENLSVPKLKFAADVRKTIVVV